MAPSAKEEDTGAPNYAGFGVETEGHVFISARGKTPADNKVKVQAHGEITLVTESSFIVGSKSSALVHTPQNVMLSGNDGVFIAGGTFLPESAIEIPAGGDASPTPPAYLANVANAVSFVSKMWTNVDAAFAGIEIASAACDLYTGVREAKGWKKFAAAVRPIINGYIANWGGNTTGAVGLGDHPVTFGAKGSTVIHGESGLILGSMGSAGLYSALGTTLGSLVGVGITAPTASIQGGIEVAVKSPLGGVSISAKKQVEILGGKGIELASRHGTALVRGKQVVLGSKSGGDKQEETDAIGAYAVKIGVAAKEELRLTGGKSTVLNATKTAIAGDIVGIAAGKKFGVATKKVALRGGESVAIGTPKFGLNMSTSNLVIGNVAKELPAEPAWKNPREAEALAALGSDTPMQDMKPYMDEINKARQEYEDKWYEWVGRSATRSRPRTPAWRSRTARSR
ncbi:MAG: hypothetical protein M5U28_13170 [Sandaracinaceae bacterium]|nr:hypothetical protein [Sandaracinaceae bacterium]